MKVFLINLKRSPDRRKRVVPHLQQRGVQFEVFDAVDGLQLSDADMQHYADMEAVKKHPNWLTKGTIGACLSHYNIYKKVVDENLEGACILEDDVVVCDKFAEILKSAEALLPKYKFIMLYYTSWQQMELKDMSEHVAPGYGLYHMENLEGLNSAAGYIISKELCKNMMDFVLPIRNGADSWTEFSRQGAIPEIYSIYPQPIKLAYAKSTIDYLQKGSISSRISSAINNYKIFPFYQLFKIRRKMLIEKMSRIHIQNT